MMKRILIIIVSTIFVSGLVNLYLDNQRQRNMKGIASFEECVAQGYPIAESYPPICKTPDGRSFTQDIENELEYSDLIHVDSPRPNYKIVSPLMISGSARGSWFWEANSTAELYDSNGKSLGTAFIIAQGDWMSEDFVPFEGKMEFKKPATITGKLILRNYNPSGMPENQKELEIPVQF